MSENLTALTVNLTELADAAMNETAELKGLSQTDVVNRALQVYAYIERHIESGGGIYVSSGPGSCLSELVIL